MEQKSITIPLPSIPRKLLGTAQILTLSLMIAAFFIGVLFTKVSYLEKGASSNSPSAILPQAAGVPTQPQAPAPGVKVDVSEGSLPVEGNKDAKVTVIEFGDFQCPFCKRLFDETLPGLRNDYIKTGKIKFSYRHFPLTAIHPNATKAAMGSECANEQGKFWEYHDSLYKNQTAWANLDNAKAVDEFKTYAKELGLDMGSFNSCIDSDKYKKNIDDDTSAGTKAGVNGTPATFVNGQLVSGAQPYSAFKTIIDQELSQ